MPKPYTALRDTIVSALAGLVVAWLAQHAPYVHVSKGQVATEILIGGGAFLHCLHGHTHVFGLIAKVEQLVAKAEKLVGFNPGDYVLRAGSTTSTTGGTATVTSSAFPGTSTAATSTAPDPVATEPSAKEPAQPAAATPVDATPAVTAAPVDTPPVAAPVAPPVE